MRKDFGGSEMNEKQFEQLLKITIGNAVQKELAGVVQDVRQVISQPQVKEVIKVKEVRRDSAWFEENIGTIADLGDFETEEDVLEAWKQAREFKKAKEEQKIVIGAIEIIAVAGFVTETKEQTIQALKSYEPKVREDLLVQVKRNYSNPEKIEDELTQLLQPYTAKFETVRRALGILQSSVNQKNELAGKR